jgi:hypothetical protein
MVEAKSGWSHLYFTSHDRENSLAIPTMAKKRTRLPPYSFFVLYSCVKIFVCKVDSRHRKSLLPTVDINIIIFAFLFFNARQSLYRVFSKVLLTCMLCKQLIFIYAKIFNFFSSYCHNYAPYYHACYMCLYPSEL